MAPPNNDGPYDPPIPTYEQAVSTRRDDGSTASMALPSPSNFDPLSPMGEAYYAPEHESRSLLRYGHQRSASSSSQQNTASAARSRTRPSGYRPPTVETDDEDSTWSSSDSEDDGGHRGSGRGPASEAAHVRREMQELEMEDPLNPSAGGHGHDHGRGRSSIFGKTIGFSLPRWRWNWRWSMPRMQIRLPSGPADESSSAAAGLDWRRRFSSLPRFSRLRSSEADADAAESGRIVDADGTVPAAASHTSRWSLPSLSSIVVPTSSASLVVFARLLGLVIVIGFIYLIFVSDLLNSVSRRIGNQSFEPESIRVFIQSQVKSENMEEMVQHFSSYAHVAGSQGDLALAIDVKNLFERYGLESVVVDEYYVYLNYPTADGRAVEILDADGKATWRAKLEEDEHKDQGGEATVGHQTYAFHGLSKSGDVRGPLLYANYGSRQDFQKLHDMGIDTKGAIALVRYYGSESDRALKVKAAELAGFAGCIIYSDPSDDGFHRGEVAPNGAFMPADGVQRGSVSLMSWVVGDVLTPGWESKRGLPRMKPAASSGLVQIPSLPLSWRDAQTLLQRLHGIGQRVPDGWSGGVPDVGDDGYWTGDASASPIVRLKNEQDEVTEQPIWNVYGRIEGVEQSAKKVIIGNHRDAWTFGASDPHSGTAIMLEVARIFGDLVDHGWRPLRTIEFMSWDAEEYNLIGSTEYVELNLDALRGDALAYINLDTAVAGRELHAAGSPIFTKLLMQVLKRVGDPNVNASLFDLWSERHSELEVLGAGSDYVAFQDIAGTSSIDLHFDHGADNILPLHSAYENFDWMKRVGDPGFVYHGMLAQVVGLLAIELCDRPVLPFDMTAYAGSIVLWGNDLIQWVEKKHKEKGAGTSPVEFQLLRTAMDDLVKAVGEFEGWEPKWDAEVRMSNGWEPAVLGRQREEYNNRMSMFETDLLDLEVGGGFRHVLFGPRLWDSYAGDLFPAVVDAVEANDWPLVNRTVAKVADIIRHAGMNLIV